MGPIRKPRWEQKRTEGYVIVSSSCGVPREDVYQYFFTCPNYTEIRLTMMKNLNFVQTIDLNLLTCGSDD
jgi:hypothetical protein